MQQGFTDFLNNCVLLCRANLNYFMLFLFIYWDSIIQMELLTPQWSHFYLLLSQFARQFYFSSLYSLLSQWLYCNLYSFSTDTLSKSFNVSTLAKPGLPSLYLKINYSFYSISFSSPCTPSNCDSPSDRLLINEHWLSSFQDLQGDLQTEQLTFSLLSCGNSAESLIAITDLVRLSCISWSRILSFLSILFSSSRRVMMWNDYSSALCCFSKSTSIFLKYSDCYLSRLQIILSFSQILSSSSLFYSSFRLSSRTIISIVRLISYSISCCQLSSLVRIFTFYANSCWLLYMVVWHSLMKGVSCYKNWLTCCIILSCTSSTLAMYCRQIYTPGTLISSWLIDLSVLMALSRRVGSTQRKETMFLSQAM